jgi:hypothetical protein
MSEPKILNVVYKFIDGAHIFSSTDPLIQGLYAASTELKEAFEDVPVQAKTLLHLNHKIEVDVIQQIPYEEFLNQVLGSVTKALATKTLAVKNLPDRAERRITGVAPPSSAISLRATELRVA